MAELQKISGLISRGQLDEALAELDAAIAANPADAEALTLRGKVRWRKGDTGGAMTDYTAASKLDPDGQGAMLLAHCNEIQDFYNHDLYNP